MDENFVQQYCMARNIRRQSRSIISPSTQQQNQQEPLSLDNVNHNLQTYFNYEWDISYAYYRCLFSLQESMNRLELKIKKPNYPFGHMSSREEFDNELQWPKIGHSILKKWYQVICMMMQVAVDRTMQTKKRRKRILRSVNLMITTST